MKPELLENLDSVTDNSSVISAPVVWSQLTGTSILGHRKYREEASFLGNLILPIPRKPVYRNYNGKIYVLHYTWGDRNTSNLHTASYSILKTKYYTFKQPLGISGNCNKDKQIPEECYESCPLCFSLGRGLIFFPFNPSI